MTYDYNTTHFFGQLQKNAYLCSAKKRSRNELQKETQSGVQDKGSLGRHQRINALGRSHRCVFGHSSSLLRPKQDDFAPLGLTYSQLICLCHSLLAEKLFPLPYILEVKKYLSCFRTFRNDFKSILVAPEVFGTTSKVF